MRKIFGLFVSILLIVCGISYSVVAINHNKNINLDDEKVSTNTNAPLTIRVEAKQIGYRIWLLKAYVKNNWQEKINVKWSHIPSCFAVRYIYPSDENLEILVYYPYRRLFSNFVTFFKFLNPGEEKLVQIAVFYGISNYIIPGFADNIDKYIDSFPLLPEGDYRFEAIINSYYVNSSDSQYYGSGFINDTVVFHLAAPK